MRFLFIMNRSAIAGALSGTLFLGIAFRLITLLIAYIRTDPLNLTMHNMAEVLLLSLVLGIIGGILFCILHEIFKDMRLKIAGMISSIFLFVTLGLVQILRGFISLSLLPVQLAMFLLALAMFLLYGIFLAVLAEKLIKN